jgi:hypothetical protein
MIFYFSKVAASFNISTNNVWGVQFCHFLPSPWYFHLSHYCHLHRCKVVSWDGCDLHCPEVYDVERFFMIIGHQYVFAETSIQVLHPFLCGLFVFLLLLEFFIYSRYKSFIRYVIWKYSLTLCMFSFHFLMVFIETQVLCLNIVEAQFIHFFLLFVLGVS